MYSNKSNINSIALAKTTSKKRGYVIGLGLLLALLMLVVSFFVARPLSANAEVTTTPTSVVVGELWNAEEERFNSDNLAILQRYIYGSDLVTPSKIDAMAEEGMDRLALNSKTVPAGFYKDTAYPAKTSTQDIVVTLHGFEWYLNSLDINDYGEGFRLTILELSPVSEATIADAKTMEEFTDKFNVFGLYIDYNDYDLDSGKVSFILTNANRRTYDLSRAVIETSESETTTEFVTINSERLVLGLDYKVDSTVDNGQESTLIISGEGMYADYIEKEVSPVRPNAVVTPEIFDSGIYTSTTPIISNGYTYNTLSHKYQITGYKKSLGSKYGYKSTMTVTTAGNYSLTIYAYTSTSKTASVGIGSSKFTISCKSFNGATVNGAYYSGGSGNYYIGTNIWNAYSSVTVSDSYNGSWNPSSSRGGTYKATSVGSYTMTISPSDTANYTGSVSVSWKVLARPMSKVVINLSATSLTYNGAAQSVSVSSCTGSVGGTTYTLPSSKYSVSGTTSATNVGTYTVTVKGDGSSITGSGTASWTIGALNISNCSVSLGSKTFTGNSQSTWVSSCTYNGYNVGTASLSGTTSATNHGTYNVTVTGSGNLTGSVSKSWTILPYFGALTISGISSSYDYTGSAIKPTPTVTSGLGKTMTSGTHYSVTYSNNINVGTATVTVKGLCCYSGSGSKTFSIVQRTLESISFSGTTSFTYDTLSKSVSVVVKSGGVTLTKGTHYNLYGTTSASGEGKYGVYATGISPYKGTTSTIYWYINERTTIDLTALSQTTYTYTGSACKPTPTVKTSSSGYTVSNYTTTYSNNVNAGTATCKVTGTGTNIATSATDSMNFTISPRNVSATTIASVGDQTYTGAAIKPTPKVTYNGMTLVSGTDFTYSYASNTNVGTATIYISGKGNYTGSQTKSITFKIVQRDISTCTITYSGTEFTYNGSSQGPTISSIKYGSNTVTTASISGNKYTDSHVKAGKSYYTATISGSGNLKGSVSLNWYLYARNMSNTTIAAISAQTYTGANLTPSSTVTDTGISKTLTKDTDYTFSWSNNKTVTTTAKITATGKGNYTGSKSLNFTISARAASTITYTYSSLSFTYNGEYQGPTISTAKYNGNTVTTATISENSQKKAGSYTATITGTDNLTGTTTVGWTISPYPISSSGVTFTEISAQTYTTSAITQSITLKYNGMTLTKGTDYTETYTDNTNVGTATITFKGNGNYSGSISKTFAINARAISAATFDSIANKIYTTNAITPTPKLRYGNDSPLVPDTDYKISSYSNNINVGTATITVTGMGNYTGTHSTTFSIVAKALENSMFTSIGNHTYTTADITPTPTLTFNGKTLVSGTDYQSITYANNHNVGTATITVTGKGNYNGNASTTFNIVARPLTSGMIAAIADQTYTGNQIKPTPSLSYSNDTPMVAGTDYSTTFTYKDNINVAFSGSTVIAKASVTVTGIGNYSGTATMIFKIVQKDLASCTVELSSYNYTYNTSTQSVSVTVKIGSTVISDTNYSVSGDSARNQGTYTVTVSAKANTNLKNSNSSKSFVIARRNLSDITVNPIPPQRYIHDGEGNATAVTLDSNELKLIYGNDNPMALTTDYTFTYTNATSIYEDTTFQDTSKSKPYITITGQGNYVGTRTEYFIIYDNNLALDPEASVTLPYSTHVYTGHAIRPTVTAKWSSTTLTLDTDYKVAYANNTNKGTATVTITGIGAYHGVVTRTFTITAADISYLKPAEMTLSKDGNNYYEDIEYVYTGNVNNPTPRVQYTHSKHYVHGDSVNCASVACTTSNCNCSGATVVTLTNYTDYTFTITNNINAGTALVTFTGKGNYTGTNYTSFIINPQNIGDPNPGRVDVNGIQSAGYQYTGSAITPDVTIIYYNGNVNATLKYRKDYSRSYTDNINAGQATLTITGIGNFTGTNTVHFNIISVPVDPDDDRLDFEDLGSYVYTGSAITPEIHATFNTKPLKENVDFTVTYSNNTNVGTATATIKGITGGNFEGTITKNFTITAKKITELNYQDNFGGRYAYTGSKIEPVISISYNSKTLVKGTDFDVTYTNNIAIGQGTINISAKGNYSGTLTGNFTIYSYNMDQLTPTLDTSNTTYRGKNVAVKPAVTLNDPEAEFTVTYTNNFEPGTATATITGKGNYKGTRTINYQITEASVSSASVTAVASDAYFTDRTFNPDLRLEYTTSVLNQDGTTDTHTEILERDVDFEVTSIEVDSETNIGIARIQGLNNFLGTRSIEFNVVTRDITTVDTNTLEDAVYTGEAITPEVILTLDGETLVVDDDYTIEYTNNTNAGTAIVTITGIGLYSGTRTLTFEIAKRELDVNPTYVAEDVYYEYGSLPQLVDETVAEYGEFEWLVPNFIAGTNEYEWNFFPFDRDNYEILSGKETFTAIDVTIERIETEFAEGKDHKAYDTFNSDNVTVRVLYSNGVYQELLAKDYKVSLGQNEHMVAGEIIYVTVEEGGQEFTESMGIVKARPITVTFGDYANLTENGENQTITVDVEGLLEGYENAYSIVYHNLSNGSIGNSITTGGNYRVEVIVTDNNYVIEGAGSITFNVKSQAISSSNVAISSEEGFEGGATVEVKTYETAEALISAYNLSDVDFGGRYLRAYTFEVNFEEVTISDNTEATAKVVKVALTAEDIVPSDALKLYAVRNGQLVALDYTVEDGKFVFNCELTDAVVFVEEVEDTTNFNWMLLVWSLVGLIVVGAVIGVVLYFDIKNKKRTKKSSDESLN